MGARRAKTDEVVLVAGREVAISNPGKVLFPGAGYTKLDLVQYYLAVAEGALRGAGGRPNVLVRYPNGIGRGVLLPEARAGLAAPVARGGVAPLPLRTERGGSGAARRGRARLDGQPCVPRAPPASRPRRGPGASGRAAGGPRSGPGRRVGPDPRGGAGGRGDARGDFGLTGWPKTSGSRGAARHRAHRAALELRRGAPRGPGAGAGGRAPRAGDRHQQVVEGRAPRRVRGLQPECQGPHRGLGLFGAADTGCARVRAPSSWERARRVRPGRLHHGDDAGALRGDRGPARGDRRPRRLARIAAGALGAARARGAGRRALAAALPEAARASPRACSRPGAGRRSIR